MSDIASEDSFRQEIREADPGGLGACPQENNQSTKNKRLGLIMLINVHEFVVLTVCEVEEGVVTDSCEGFFLVHCGVVVMG
jgi:hypothetical protein